MSAAESAFGGSNGGREFGSNELGERGLASAGPAASAVGPRSEVIAMVLGFAVFWPIGLAILGYKLWQRRFGGDDLQDAAAAAKVE